MTREDGEPLAELARLNRAMAPLAMRMMEGSASPGEQLDYAQRMITACERLRRRATPPGVVIDGDVLDNTAPAPPLPRIGPSRQES